MKKTILVIDDDPNIPSVIKAVLNERGYHVVVARDGWAGVHGILNVTPDLILLDLNMPVMDGMTALATLKQSSMFLKGGRLPRTIILSGKVEKDKVLRAKELGADGFIAKPFDIKTLIQRVESALVKLDSGELAALLESASPFSDAGNSPHFSGLKKEEWDFRQGMHKDFSYQIAVRAKEVIAFGCVSNVWLKAWPSE